MSESVNRMLRITSTDGPSGTVSTGADFKSANRGLAARTRPRPVHRIDVASVEACRVDPETGLAPGETSEDARKIVRRRL